MAKQRNDFRSQGRGGLRGPLEERVRPLKAPTQENLGASSCPHPGAIDMGNFGHTDVLSTFGGSKKGGGYLKNYP